MPVRRSLKRRLLLLALIATVAVWLGAALLTYHSTRKEVNELLDAHLAQVASLLVAQSMHEIGEIEGDDVPQLSNLSMNVAFQVWEDGKKLRLHSPNAPESPLSKNEQGFSDVVINGQKWRVFSAWDSSHEAFLIHVAELASKREQAANSIAYNLLLPLLFSFPLLAIALWVAVTRGLHPLVRLTREVARREPDNLEPLNVGTAPREVVPLIEHLNHLFSRIDASMQKERRFTADAAHELRTPVAAIKAQAQVAQAASAREEREHSISNVIQGCDRAAHLIDQLLTIARVDVLGDEVTEQCQLRALSSEAIADIAPAALGKGVQLELTEGDEAVVRGDKGLLRVLLRNLLDNAVRYTPHGTSVRVSIGTEQGLTFLSVSDDGPGIPEAERGRVLERFYRLMGTQASGSGLGLSIVKRIAEIHGATLSLTTSREGKGLNVKITFPKH